MQVYAPRDPLREVLTGRITLRQFRVMVEGLPLDRTTPIGRALHGTWGDAEYLARDIATSLRVLATDYRNVNRSQGSPPSEVEPIAGPTLTRYQRAAAKARKRVDKHQRASEVGLMAVLGRSHE